MTVKAAAQCTKDRKEWRVMVNMYLIEFNAAIFAWPVFFRTALPRSGRISAGVGCRYMLRLGQTVKRAKLLNVNAQVPGI